ncbi:hypothetical protein CsatA_009883 [Cannabis sativa]
MLFSFHIRSLDAFSVFSGITRDNLMMRMKKSQWQAAAKIMMKKKKTISGRPTSAASMAVGQFFNPDEGKLDVSPWFMLQSSYSHKEMFVKEDHPLALNLSFSISLGLLPATLSLKIAGCGIKYSGLQDEETEDVEIPHVAF